MLLRVKKEISQLRESIALLRDHENVVCLKTGTEVEDMGFSEIEVMREISSEILPLTVKIGGAEARQDIRFMFSLDIDCILAPMIESIYALGRFVETSQEIQLEFNKPMSLAFNLETINATKSLDQLIETKAFLNIQQVTIGRDDLSRSMHLGIDDEEVMNTVQEATKKISNQKILTSLGGGISLQNIKRIVNKVDTNYLNTRHIMFTNDHRLKKKPEKILFKILNWEQQLYLALSNIFPERKKYYEKRIGKLAERCQYLEIHHNKPVDLQIIDFKV